MMSEQTIYSAFTCKKKGFIRHIRTDVGIRTGDKIFNGTALWDTGATSSCISQKVINTMGLIATGQMNVLTPQGSMQVGTYLVDIFLPNKVLIKDVSVCGSNIDNQNLDMLIGMDIISLGDFAITHSRDTTIFSFCAPSKKPIDFALSISFENKAGKHGKGKGRRKK